MRLLHNAFLAATLVALTASACSARPGADRGEARVPEDRDRTPMTGMPNPASVHCEALGGSLEIRTDADGGQYGMCRLPNGRICEEWALYRDGECTAGPER